MADPYLLLLLYATIVSFLVNLPYRYLVNQQEAAAVKAKVKELQEQSKYVRRQGNAMLATKLMNDALVENSKLTKLTLKPMMVGLILVIVVLPILGGPYSDATFAIKDGKGSASVNGNTYTAEVTGSNVKLSNGVECAAPCRKSFDGSLWNIVIENNNVVLQRIVALLPVPLPFVADDLGWLGWYSLVAIALMMPIRKLLKINL